MAYAVGQTQAKAKPLLYLGDMRGPGVGGRAGGAAKLNLTCWVNRYRIWMVLRLYCYN